MADKIWSYFSEQTKDRLRVVADGRHVAMAEAAALLVMEALEPRPEGGSTTAGAPSPPSLDDAASLFLRHLPQDQADLIRELCLDNGARPWQYLMSYIHLAHERGETAVMASETVLDEIAAPPAASPGQVAAGATGTCLYCGGAFQAVRRGQKYCPDPEDGPGCGRKAFLEDLHQRRPQTPFRGRQPQAAPTPSPPPAPTLLDTVALRQAMLAGTPEG